MLWDSYIVCINMPMFVVLLKGKPLTISKRWCPRVTSLCTIPLDVCMNIYYILMEQHSVRASLSKPIRIYLNLSLPAHSIANDKGPFLDSWNFILAMHSRQHQSLIESILILLVETHCKLQRDATIFQYFSPRSIGRENTIENYYDIIICWYNFEILSDFT